MIYLYKCENCGEFTVERSIKEEPLKECITHGCKCKVVQVFKSVNVNLKFEGSFNNTK